MSIEIMSLVFKKSKTTLAARLVLLALADSASDEGYCFPSVATVAKKAGVSEPTTREYLHAFEKIGLVTSVGRAGNDGRQTSNGYTINLDVIGNDEITKDLMISVRPPSKRLREPITVLYPQASKAVISTPSNPLIPPPSKGVRDESSFEPSDKPSKEPKEDGVKAVKPQTPKPEQVTPTGEVQSAYETLLGYKLNGEWAAGESKAARSIGLSFTLDQLKAAYKHYKAEPFWKDKRLTLRYLSKQMPEFFKGKIAPVPAAQTNQIGGMARWR